MLLQVSALWPVSLHFLHVIGFLQYFTVCPYWKHCRHNIGQFLNAYRIVSAFSPGMYRVSGNKSLLKVSNNGVVYSLFVLIKSTLVTSAILYLLIIKYVFKFSYVSDITFP